MRTQIHFSHMDRSEAVESFATEKLEAVVQDLMAGNDCHLQAWMVSEKPKSAKGAPEFKCEVSLRYPPKKEIFIDKRSDDMYDAIHQAAQALSVAVREDSKKEIYQRNDLRNQIDPTTMAEDTKSADSE